MQNKDKRPFNWRGFISITTGLACLGLTITGIVIFFTPPGRIANWNHWQFWGLAKQQWNGLHIWFSVLFLITTIWHLYFNWRCLINYFKDKTKKHLVLRWEWGLALVLMWIITVGTIRNIPPFSSFLNWHRTVKHTQNQ